MPNCPVRHEIHTCIVQGPIVWIRSGKRRTSGAQEGDCFWRLVLLIVGLLVYYATMLLFPHKDPIK